MAGVDSRFRTLALPVAPSGDAAARTTGRASATLRTEKQVRLSHFLPSSIT